MVKEAIDMSIDAGAEVHAASFTVRSELEMRRASIAEWQLSDIAVRPAVVCNR